MNSWLRYDPTLQTLVLEQQAGNQIFPCTYTTQLLAVASYVWTSLNRHMKGLIMAHQTTQKLVNAANARTSYYKKQAKELKAEVKRLNELLDNATAPNTNKIGDAKQLLLTKVPIAYRRSTKMNGALIPVKDEMYIVAE
jgi:hypothetical protein